MLKFQITINFEMDEEFMTKVPAHRNYINQLINNGTIEYYSVSLEVYKCWIVINALNKDSALRILSKSTLFKYWNNIEINQIFVFDGQNFRIPGFQLN